ncbi:ABC transporter substrate-binding protein [Nibricoccus sp. IMCC34717]|uniref:ABC transporter substrate-binding protein n=1 Tax=Nibricoccus sp. IMCC34717 TaxID=3034021 RepID=UPI00384E6A84
MRILVPIVLFLASLAHVCAAEGRRTVLRVGLFPNVTHAQGLIGRITSHDGNGWFEKQLGPDIEIQWFIYNAGPSAMEAIFAGSIDMTYVGPSPAINAHVRSRGEDIRVVAGAALGGAALLVRPEAHIEKVDDFMGRKVATPQLGNTQDVAARIWLRKQGFNVQTFGGDVLVLPTANPDQLTLFKQGKLDAVWTVEPWVSRIEKEAGGRVFYEQPDVVTTILVAGVEALRDKREVVERFVAAHRVLTEWIQANPEEAQKLVQRAITNEVRREIPLSLVQSSWKRLHFTSAIERKPLDDMARDARTLGFLRGKVSLDNLILTLP